MTTAKFSPFINRELSWLAFNDRVLEEAQDTNYPILERLKFLAIVSSNLDEFFMIRVAGLERQVKRSPHSRSEDGMKIEDTLYQIREWVLSQKARQGIILNDLLKQLRDKGLDLQIHIPQIDEAHLKVAKKILPEVKIYHFNSPDAFHQLVGSQIYVFVRLKNRFAVLGWPEKFDRLVASPLADNIKSKHHFILAEKLIAAAAGLYFENETVLEAFPFKVIRDAEVDIDPETDPEDLLSTIEEAILNRAKQTVVRLEVDAPTISDGALLLASSLKLRARSVYRYDVPLDLKILWRLHGLEEFSNLRFSVSGKKSGALSLRVPDLVKAVKGQDILLHHPYDSFDTVVKLLQAAAQDPSVFAIRQTLYRTGKNSPIVAALIEAAKRGKQVTVFIELRARFDEVHNIELAKEFKRYGVKVLEGFSDKKIHCKLTQILRREKQEVISFVHIGTGNYNPSTAKLYTDLGLLTTSKSFGRDAEKIFRSLQNKTIPRTFETFVAAPVQLHKKILDWIRFETKRSLAGDKKSHIIAKINALVDVQLVEALYKASKAGVKIDLIVRGACMLRPGVPGLSENIRVTSIVEKYLEHSRIYFFQNGEHPQVYLSSADWMPRNFHKRIEVAFPIHDSDLKKYIRDVVLENLIKDNQKARQLMPDGQWIKIIPRQGESSHRAQLVFDKLAENNYEGTPLYSRFVFQKDEAFNLPEGVKPS